MKKNLKVILSVLLCFVMLSALAVPAFAAPGKVKNLKASAVAPTSVTLKWSKASSVGGYEVQRLTSGNWRTVMTTKKTTAKVKDLTLGTTYQFRVRAYRSVSGKLQYGAVSAVVRAKTAPAKVSSFKAKNKTSNSLTLSWKASSGATGYRVQQYIDKEWVNIAKSTKKTSLAVKKLVPNKTYKFRILAYIKANGKTHYGAYTTLKAKTAMLPKPTNLKASPVNETSLTLSWSAVPTAKKYIVYKVGTNTQKEIAKTTKTKLKISSLKASTDYMYAVVAMTVIDDRNYYSQFSSNLSVRTAPAQTKNLQVTSSTDSAVNLRWSMVSGAEGYEIWQYKSDTLSWVYIGSAAGTTYSVNNLSTMTTYRFKVRAYHTVNGGKLCGAYSGEAQSTTLMAPVSNLKFENATGNSLSFSWNPIATATGYLVEIRTMNENAFRNANAQPVEAGGRMEVLIASLEENTSYVVRVRPVYGQAVGSEQLVTALTAPAAVKNLKASRVTAGIFLSWDDTAGAKGYEVSRYSSGGNWEVIATTSLSFYDDNNVETDISYSYHVRPYYTIGAQKYYGAYADPVSEKPLPPSVRGIEAYNITETSFYVRWSSPQTSTTYRISLSEDGGSERNVQPQVVVNGDTTILLIDNLSAGGTYTVNVFNNVNGIESIPSFVTIKTKPGKVVGLTAGSPAEDSLLLNWTVTRGAERYEIQYGVASGNDFDHDISVASLPYRVTGLKASTDYRFRVRAINTANGLLQLGAWSEVATGKTAAASSTPTQPATPSGLTASDVTASSVRLSWQAVSGVSGYLVSISDGTGWRELGTTLSNTYTASSLKSGTAYTFQVQSYIGNGGSRIKSNPAVTSVTTSGSAQPSDPTEPSDPGNLPKITGFTVTLDPTGSSYYLRWEEFSSEAFYTVERKNPDTNQWETISSDLLPFPRCTGIAPNRDLHIQASTNSDMETTVNWDSVAAQYEIRNQLVKNIPDFVVTTGLTSPTAKLRLAPGCDQTLRVSAVGQTQFRIIARDAEDTRTLAYSEFTEKAYTAYCDKTIRTDSAPALTASSSAGVKEAYALMITQAINNTKNELNVNMREDVVLGGDDGTTSLEITCRYQNGIDENPTVWKTKDGTRTREDANPAVLSSIFFADYARLYDQHRLSTFQTYVSSVSATKNGNKTIVTITLKPESVTTTQAMVYHPLLAGSLLSPYDLDETIEEMKASLNRNNVNATATVGPTTIEATINSNYTLDSYKIQSQSVINAMVGSTSVGRSNQTYNYTYTFTR